MPIALLWATCLVVLIGLQNGAKPEDRAQALAIAASGFYTLLLFSTRRWWLPRLARHPLRNAIASGVLSAALVETLFLVAEKITGASGVAADPNLAMDLLITMPWYFGMVATFVRVQRVRRFPTEVVLLLGGIYEACVDGFLGGVFGGAILNPAFFLVIPTVWIWLFIPVYSSILLPPAWITATDARPVASGRPRVRFRRWRARSS